MASPALVASLIRDVLEGLQVFNTLDKLNIPEELLRARARNIVSWLAENYFVSAYPRLTRGPGEYRHMYGCACGGCPGEWTVNEAGRDERTKKESR